MYKCYWTIYVIYRLKCQLSGDALQGLESRLNVIKSNRSCLY